MELKNAITLFIAFLLAFPLVYATNDAEALGYWSAFQNKEGGSGITNIDISFPSQATTSSIGLSSGFQPIIADFDGDFKQDIAITSGTSLLAYNVFSDSMTIKAEITMPEAQSGKASMIKDRDTGIYYLVIPATNLLLIYGLNSSSWTLHRQINVTAANATFTKGLACTSLLSGTYGDTCAWGAIGKRWAEYRYKTNATASVYIGDSLNVSSPVFSNNFNGIKAAIGVYNGKVDIITPISMTKSFQVNAGTCSLGNYFFLANSLGGHDLLYTSCGSIAGSCLQSWTSAGSSYKAFTNTANNCNSGAGSQHFIVGGYFRNLHYQVCDVRQPGSGFANIIYCYNDSSIALDASFTSKGANGSAFAADINLDGYTELFDGSSFIDLRTNKMVNLSGNAKGQVAASDVNGDTNAEVIGSVAGKAYVTTSGDAGSVVTSSSYEFTLNSRDLDRNFGNPVCVNTTVVFSAANCRNLPLDLCNYALNSTASQYLYTTCGKGSVLLMTAGLPVAAAPQVSCFYNRSGLYTFPVFITTVVTGTRPLSDKYWTVSVYVNGSLSGGGCNNNPYYGAILRQQPYNASTATSAQSNAAKGLFSGFLEGSGIGLTATWLILMLVIGLICLFAASGSDFSGGAIMAVLACLEILMLFIGVSLGFIGTGTIISITFVGTAVVVLWIRSAATGG